jgi:hypothetical protein
LTLGISKDPGVKLHNNAHNLVILTWKYFVLSFGTEKK